MFTLHCLRVIYHLVNTQWYTLTEAERNAVCSTRAQLHMQCTLIWVRSNTPGSHRLYMWTQTHTHIHTHCPHSEVYHFTPYTSSIIQRHRKRFYNYSCPIQTSDPHTLHWAMHQPHGPSSFKGNTTELLWKGQIEFWLCHARKQLRCWFRIRSCDSDV